MTAWTVSRLRSLALLALFAMPAPALAAKAPKPAVATTRAGTQPAAKPASTRTDPGAGAEAAASHIASAIPGLPRYEPPPAYSVDLVIHTGDGKDMVMHRSIDNGRLRTDFEAEGQRVAMIEVGDEPGTSYVLMPGEKRAIKQTRAAMEPFTANAAAESADVTPTVESKIEDLGATTLDGRAVRKVRMSVPDGSAIGWFDPASGAPVKMESDADGKTASIEWKNMKAGPQPAAMFEIPKGYEVMDMDAMMAQMKSMGAMSGMGSTAALGGLAGMGGTGAMGGVKGMAGGMGQQFGSQMGGSLGATLGASLGGPLGAMAGQYLGGRIGGMLGGAVSRKAVDVVTPGK